MRVVVDGYVYGNSPTGGISRYWSEVIRASSSLELPVRFDVAVSPESAHPAGVSCCSIGSLRAYWSAVRGNIFHSTYYTQWPRMTCPSVTTVYDFIDAMFPLMRPNGEGFVARQLESLRAASAIIAISKSTRDLAMSFAGIDPNRIFVAYPGVSASFAQPLPDAVDIHRFRSEWTGGAPYLVHVGARRNYKNFRTILKAFCRAAPSMDRHLLIFGGKHPLSEDELDWIYAAGVENRIHFCATIDDSVLRMAYAGADAMVHASHMEGFGIPVIEALACGTGLILSDIDVYREIADGQAVFVQDRDMEGWCQAMQAPVPIQAAWREETLRRFCWEDTARMHLQAYQCALG